MRDARSEYACQGCTHVGQSLTKIVKLIMICARSCINSGICCNLWVKGSRRLERSGFIPEYVSPDAGYARQGGGGSEHVSSAQIH